MSESVEQFGYKQELKRALTLKDLVIYGMLFMVIIAPMSVYGYIQQSSQGMSPLVYLVGATAMFFTVLGYMKFSNRFPIAGSVYAYVQRGINPHVGFIAGWMILLDYVFIPALLYLLTANWCVALFPGTPIWVWVLIFLIINTYINVRGIESTAKADIIIFIIESLILAVFIVLGITFVFGGGGAGSLSLDPLYQPGVINISFIGSACTIACLSFLGFDGISTLAEETHDPEHTVGRATLITIIAITVLFVAQTYVAAIIDPNWEKINPDTAFFDAAAAAGGEIFRTILLAVNIIAVGIANTMAAQTATSRVLFGMSRDELLPKFFSVIHPKYKTPYLSSIFIGVLSFFVAISLGVENLVRLVNFGAISAFIMLNFAIFWFFFIKEKERDFKGIVRNLVCPLLGILILGFVWTSFDHLTQIVGFSWLAVGLVIGFVKSKGYKEVPEAFKNMKLN